MQILLDVLMPVFLIVAFGYVSVWVQLFDNSLFEALVKFTQNFAIPILLLKGISEVDLDQTFNPALLAAFYIGAMLLQYPIGWFSDRMDRRLLIALVSVLRTVAAVLAIFAWSSFTVLL